MEERVRKLYQLTMSELTEGRKDYRKRRQLKNKGKRVVK